MIRATERMRANTASKPSGLVFNAPSRTDKHAILAICCMVVALSSLAARGEELMTRLTTAGVDLPAGRRLAIPEPALRAEMPPAERWQIARRLAGKLDWERFRSGSVSAPVAVAIGSIPVAEGEGVAHTIHQAFLVRADWEALRDERLLEQVLGERNNLAEPGGSAEDAKPAAATIRELTADERRKAGLPEVEPPTAGAVDAPAGTSDTGATYAAVVLPLLNRVIVRGVLHAERRERPAAYEVAWELAPRLGPDERMAASWSPLERDAVGRQSEGDRQSYAGCGGWLGAYEIDDASGLMLIESRMVLYEPEAWFSGSKLLRSKLPLSIQENARSLRRKLAR